MAEREFDVILYGATGFTGKQTAAYFARNLQGQELRWAIGGRNVARLREVRAGLGEAFHDLPMVVADTGNQTEVDAMVARTRVLLTTVGPYAKYGTPIVDACVRLGTDYTDITGEAPWVRALIDRYHDEAAQKAIRIVPFCGFDSVPSDIGAMLLAQQMQRAGVGCELIKSFYTIFGGLNGGTLWTGLNMSEGDSEGSLADPHLLSPAEFRTAEAALQEPDVTEPVHDEDIGSWVAPFFMAPVNTRVVRRSHGLSAGYGHPYGDGFQYREFWRMPPGVSYLAATGVARGMQAALQLSKWDLARKVLGAIAPKPGEGPPEFLMDLGFFKVEFIGRASDGRTFFQTVSDSGDPNNRATVKCLCEAALALVLNREELPGGPERGGVLTPATGIGRALATRLADAGMHFDERPIT